MKNFLLNLVKKLPSYTIKVDGIQYLTRYYLFGKDRSFGNIYIHHFHSSDLNKNLLHSHPWVWGMSLILSGGYIEEKLWNKQLPYCFEHMHRREFFYDQLRLPGNVFFINQNDFHRVDLLNEKEGCWTIFFAGPRTKNNDWFFYDKETGEKKHRTEFPDAIP